MTHILRPNTSRYGLPGIVLDLHGCTQRWAWLVVYTLKIIEHFVGMVSKTSEVTARLEFYTAPYALCKKLLCELFSPASSSAVSYYCLECVLMCLLTTCAPSRP